MPDLTPVREVIAQVLATGLPTAVERKQADLVVVALHAEGYVIVREATREG